MVYCHCADPRSGTRLALAGPKTSARVIAWIAVTAPAGADPEAELEDGQAFGFGAGVYGPWRIEAVSDTASQLRPVVAADGAREGGVAFKAASVI